MNDAILINDILNGELNRFEDIMDKYHDELFKYVYNMSSNVQDTEDLLQEIFMKVYNNLNNYDSTRAGFRTWLYRIATNHVKNYFKSSYYRQKLMSTPYDDSLSRFESDAEQVTIRDKDIDKILKVMRNILKPKHLKIMMLHYFSQLTVNEISEIADIPAKTVYKAIKSSIDKIKKEVNVSDEI